MNTGNDAFDQFVKSLDLQYFSPAEIGFLGDSHHSPGAAGFRLNRLPPGSMWPAIIPTAYIADQARERLGVPLRVLSAYREPKYNNAVGGSLHSRHIRFTALDLQPSDPRFVHKLHSILLHLRNIGEFTGGLGLYKTFVHVDTDSHNRSW